MPVPRFYVPESLTANAQLALPEAAAHHAARVLRLRVGDALILFNGFGGEYLAQITAIGKHEVNVAVHAHDPVERESPLSLILIQSISAAERMDFTIQKAAELGVREIVPVESERCVVRIHGERAVKRVQHWQQIVISACEQCGRNRVPTVSPVVSLDARLKQLNENRHRWILAPEASQALREFPRPDKTIEFLVGPEGGFTEAEMSAARAAGFQEVRLGPRLLRTETAAPAMLAAVQALWGDF